MKHLTAALIILAGFSAPPSEATYQNRAPLKLTAPQEISNNKAFVDRQGNEHFLSDYKGKVVLVNFWSTLCPPCVAEMGSLDRLATHFKARPFEVLAISTGMDDATTIEDFYHKRSIKALGVFIDERRALAADFGVRGVPTTLLLDSKGRLIGRLEGAAAWDSQEIISLIDNLLGR